MVLSGRCPDSAARRVCGAADPYRRPHRCHQSAVLGRKSSLRGMPARVRSPAGALPGGIMRIAVVGTGYVGLVTGTCLAHLGHDVTCVDAMPERVNAVNRGIPPFFEPGLADLLAENIAVGRLRAVSGVAGAVAASDITILAVGTPSRAGE